MASAHGPHGLYVENALHEDVGEVLVFAGADRLLGIGWFGPRGNLILLQQEPLDPGLVATAVQRAGHAWRIALGPPALVDELAARANLPPLVHREQIYYEAMPRDADPIVRRHVVRLPVKQDRERLMRATLLLNHADLCVEPDRVDRVWLRTTVQQRIDEGSTRVIGPPGKLLAKLDQGSHGPAGMMIEGVFTFPEARGRGLATALVAVAIADCDTAPVCLHVAAANAPARAAYAKAGMQPAQTVRLLLLG